MISGHGTDQHGGRGDQAGRVRLHREAVRQRARARQPCATRSTQRQLRDENRIAARRRSKSGIRWSATAPALQAGAWPPSAARRRPTPRCCIQGESGVGKELVARTIHRNSLRSRERFVQVNCAAIPEELIESELFGHEKGSFTGATEKQVGKFEQADRGTIFLDEVGDMSPKTQAKVLRVLQEGEVERLGSARTIKVDVRVIAATNKNLEEEIEKGHVPRGSLLPPRRDPDSRAAAARAARGHPAAGAALHRTTSAARTTSGRSGSRQAALEALQRYRWSGNIRELRNTVERLIIMTARRHDRRRRPARRRAHPPAARRRRAAPKPGERRRRRRKRPARCASSRTSPSGRSWSASCARTAGTSRRPPRSSTRRAATSTRSSSSTRSRRKPTDRQTDGAGEQAVTSPSARRWYNRASQRARRSPRRSAARREGGEESPNSAGQCAG